MGLFDNEPPERPKTFREAGAKLDAEIASLRAGDLRPYSTDIGAAWPLWEEMQQEFQGSIMIQYNVRCDWFECCVIPDSMKQSAKYVFSGFGNTGAAAICSTYAELAIAKLDAALKKEPAPRAPVKESKLVQGDVSLTIVQDGRTRLLQADAGDYADTGAT